MKYILFAILLLLIVTPARAQFYDGPPPGWDWRDNNPEYRQFRNREPLPQQRGPGRGPEVEPCIYHNDCMGPKYQDRVPQGYRRPPFPDRW